MAGKPGTFRLAPDRFRIQALNQEIQSISIQGAPGCSALMSSAAQDARKCSTKIHKPMAMKPAPEIALRGTMSR